MPASLSPGDRFDRYVIEGVLGQGGMGIVYRALDPKLGRRVALKVVSLGPGGSSADGAARLMREARAAAAFDHPNAISIFDVGEVDGEPFLSMELVSGKTLRAFVGETSVAPVTRIGWLADVARALAAGHRVGLVHRDVKPENVMVRDDGVVKVLDFGIARQARGAVDPNAPTALSLASITAEGVAIGTPLYMAPEQLRGEAVDARTDQFAWGVLAYELLAGRSPWAGARDLLALAVAITGDEVKELDAAAAGVSESVAQVVSRAMAKSPAKRFPSMDAIVEALDAERTGRTAGAPRASWTRRVQVLARRRAALTAAVAAGVVVFAAATLLHSTSKQGGPHVASAGVPSDAAAEGPLLPPTPTVGKPEAIEAYREALEARRGGESGRANASLEKAIAIDPTLAEALIQLALNVNQNYSRNGRDFVTRAALHRSTLAPRDAALLRAVEALYARDPLDESSFARLLADAVESAPRDVDLRAIYAGALYGTGRLDEASAEVDRVLALAPGFAGAWALRCDIAAARSQPDEVRRLAHACTERFPRATSCMSALIAVDAPDGRCAEMETEARAEIAVDPSTPQPFFALSEALAAQGRPEAAVDGAFDQYVQRLPSPDREVRRLAGQWQYDVLYGRFEAADAEVQQVIAARPTDLEMGRMAVYRRLMIAMETDDRSGARAILEDVRRREATWDSRALDLHGRMLVAALRTGGLDRTSFDREMAAWRASMTAREPSLVDGGADPAENAALWVTEYAEIARTPADAADALAHLDPASHPELSLYPWLAAPTGNVLLLAGRGSEAVPYLRRGAADCGIASNPDTVVHAMAQLGEALEAAGDRPGACSAYARVLGYWGGAARSITAKEVRSRAQTLRCAP